MAHAERFPARHPLCTCPELTFANMNDAPPDRTLCAGGAIAHRVISGDEMAEMVARFKREAAAGRVMILNRAGGRPMPRAVGVPGRDPAPVARGDESWYRIHQPQNARGGTADLYIYDEIGYWGVSAQRLIDDLRELDADTIELHVNSPGGEVYDGIAIYNALLNHPARVNVTVDALAASAASFIAQAGHSVTMARNAEMMIHDAIGIAWDNAEGLRTLAERLDAVSDNIAGIYADRAGGTVASWRATMKAETWYSADEAVAAGLADSVVAVQRRGADDADTENRWSSRRDAISARFRYANRGATEAPEVRTGGILRADEMPVVGEANPPAVVIPADVLGDVEPDLMTRVVDDQYRRALDVGVGATAFIPADVFHAAISLAANNAPAPPAAASGPARNTLTRTVVPDQTGYDGVNLNDLLREVVTG